MTDEIVGLNKIDGLKFVKAIIKNGEVFGYCLGCGYKQFIDVNSKTLEMKSSGCVKCGAMGLRECL